MMALTLTIHNSDLAAVAVARMAWPAGRSRTGMPVPAARLTTGDDARERGDHPPGARPRGHASTWSASD